MEAYEYVAKVDPDGRFSVPDYLTDKLSKMSRIRVMLLLEGEDDSWEKLTTSEFFRGYSEMDAAYDKL